MEQKNRRLHMGMQVYADILKEDKVNEQMFEAKRLMGEWFDKMQRTKMLDKVEFSFDSVSVDAELSEEIENDENFIYNKKAVMDMDELLSVQKLTVESDKFKYDDYMRGMYNGMELIVATLEERQPLFLDEFGKFSVIENSRRFEGGEKK